MANSDLNAIRRAIAEQQGRRPRRRPRKGHRPRFRVGSTAAGRPQYGRILGSAALTLLAAVPAVGAGRLAQSWIGDHAAAGGREWAGFRALGFKPEHLPQRWPARLAVVVELRLLAWLALAAVLCALLLRPYLAVLLGVLAGVVPGNWPAHLPAWQPPDWVGEALDRQESWLRGAGPWFQFAVFLLFALMLTAWAERAQAV